MAWYGLKFDGVNDYVDLDSTLSVSGDFAWAFWVDLELKGLTFHYLASTGAFAAGEFNSLYNESTGQLGINYGGGGTAYFATDASAIVGTSHLVVVGRDAGNLKVSFCPQDGSATTSGNLQFTTASLNSKTWDFMQRGDNNADRKAKGLFSEPMLLDVWPSDAQIESLAARNDPSTVMGANLLHHYLMDTGTGTSTADVNGGPNLVQRNMPTDGSQWELIEGAAGNTANVNFDITKPTFAATATSTAPAIFTADIDYSVSKPVFAANATSTVPGSGANVTFTVSKPVFAADATNTVPVFDGDISYTANKPTFAAMATNEEPINTGDVSYTANRPSFSASGTVVSPSGATISFVRQKPDFSVDATNVIPNYAEITFTRSKPTFAATGGIVAGDVSADIDFDVRKPIFSAVAKATGQTYNSKNIIRVRPRAGRVFARAKTNIIKVR